MNYVDKIKALPIWKGNISLNPLEGGITNHNYLVKDGTSEYVCLLYTSPSPRDRG